MDTKNHDEIHALTVEEIGRQVKSLSELRQRIVEQRVAIHASRKGIPAAAIDADEAAARMHAKRFLNGSAPEFLDLPPEIDRDRILLQEQRGLDLALKILTSKDLAARAAEAVIWSEKNEAPWRALCREITLTMVRLGALESRAHELLSQCPDINAMQLPMGNIVGGRPIPELWSVEDLTKRALTENVVTTAEIRKAENVK